MRMTEAHTLTAHALTARTLKARWILPVDQPPIKDGWVFVHDDRIGALGTSGDRPPEAPVVDYGPVAILPALVNSHTHLEFSLLDQPIGEPGGALSDWILLVMRQRIDTAAERFAAVRRGMQLSIAAGVGLVGEIATLPWLPASAVSTSELFSDGLQVVALGEVLGLGEARSRDRLAALERHLQKDHHRSQNISYGVSPHAPYSTRLETVAAAVDLACAHNTTVAMHLAECPQERRLLESGEGSFAQSLRQLGVWQPGLFGQGAGATRRYLEQLSRAAAALVVHGNDLRDDEIAWLAGQPQMTVVYCPRTHAFFGHSPHPVDKLLRSGVPVALGTDSLASNPDLSIWNEVRWLLAHRPDLDWHDVLAMATIQGAKALMRPDWGRLSPGAVGRLIAVPGEVDRVEDLPGLWMASDRQPVWCA